MLPPIFIQLVGKQLVVNRQILGTAQLKWILVVRNPIPIIICIIQVRNKILIVVIGNRSSRTRVGLVFNLILIRKPIIVIIRQRIKSRFVLPNTKQVIYRGEHHDTIVQGGNPNGTREYFIISQTVYPQRISSIHVPFVRLKILLRTIRIKCQQMQKTFISSYYQSPL